MHSTCQRGGFCWKEQSDALLQKLLSEFWQGDRFIARQVHSHQSIDADSLLLYIPIILGKRLPVEIQSKLVADLKQAGGF
jgi:hypothetical protein